MFEMLKMLEVFHSGCGSVVDLWRGFYKQGVIKTSLLFPFALPMPGWGHLWDNIPKWALSKCRFFVRLLRLIKHVIRFFRNGDYKLVVGDLHLMYYQSFGV